MQRLGIFPVEPSFQCEETETQRGKMTLPDVPFSALSLGAHLKSYILSNAQTLSTLIDDTASPASVI